MDNPINVVPRPKFLFVCRTCLATRLCESEHNPFPCFEVKDSTVDFPDGSSIRTVVTTPHGPMALQRVVPAEEWNPFTELIAQAVDETPKAPVEPVYDPRLDADPPMPMSLKVTIGDEVPRDGDAT